MNTITIVLSEEEVRALIQWISLTKETMREYADRNEYNCKMGCYIDNSKPRQMHDNMSLALNTVELLKQKL